MFWSGKVDPNCVNSGGVTALGLAAQLGHSDVLEILLEVRLCLFLP